MIGVTQLEKEKWMRQEREEMVKEAMSLMRPVSNEGGASHRHGDRTSPDTEGWQRIWVVTKEMGRFSDEKQNKKQGHQLRARSKLVV